MKITLWELNESYQALVRLASQSLPKECQAQAWKLKRVMAGAKREIEDLSDSINDLMDKCGVVRNDPSNDLAKLEDFNRQSKQFMKSTEVELWGEPFKWSELRDRVSISPLDLADLDWLIIEDTEGEGNSE